MATAERRRASWTTGSYSLPHVRPCAIVVINETLRELRVEQHPDKTSIGRIERGFTFLGYWITAEGVTGVAPSAQQNFEERKARLYEQNAPPEVIRKRVELYIRRWRQGVLAGVCGVCDSLSKVVFRFQDSFPHHQRNHAGE